MVGNAVSDERIILVNRVVPVVPLMGAFIATMKWDPRKSLFYVFIGENLRHGFDKMVFPAG